MPPPLVMPPTSTRSPGRHPPSALGAALFTGVALFLGALPLGLHGQDPPGEQGPPALPGDGVYVPAHHWTAGVLARLDVFPGSGSRIPWGFGTIPRRQVDEALRADRDDLPTGARRLIQGYRARFLEEVGEPGPTEPRWRPRWAGGHVDLRAGGGTEVLGTGSGFREPVVPPDPLGEPGSLAGSFSGAVELGPLTVVGGGDTDEVGRFRASDLYAAGVLGPVALWAGRRAPAFGGSAGGAVVLDGRVFMDGGGLALARPWVLPGFLGHLGPVRFETHLARFEQSSQVERPFFWSARGSLIPHPRLQLAINRGAIFGGDPAPAITFAEVVRTLFGFRREHEDDGFPRTSFANQIVAVEARYRLFTGDVPTSVYFEWGSEDSAGSWWNVPGIIAGIHVAMLPGAPGLSLGLERAHFAVSCCGNPPWYRHHHFRGGWAEGGRLLGHSLGGHGDEWLVYGRADLMEARLRSSWQLFHRERGEENLFAPDREGSSLGAALEAWYRIRPRMDVVFDGRYERGSGGAWDEGRAFLGLRAFF